MDHDIRQTMLRGFPCSALHRVRAEEIVLICEPGQVETLVRNLVRILDWQPFPSWGLGGIFVSQLLVPALVLFIVGWALSAVNDRHLTLRALDMAVKRRCPDPGLLHHPTKDARTPARTTSAC